MTNQLFYELKMPRAEAQQMAVAALAALEPVYNSIAQRAPKHASPDAPCWKELYECAEFEALKEALPYLLVHTFQSDRSRSIIDSIVADNQQLTAEDLFLDCYEHIVTRIPKVFLYVHNRYKAKVGMVGKEKGWLLYMQTMLSNRLIDLARHHSPNPRPVPSPKPRINSIEDLFEKAGQMILSAEELHVGDRLIRNSNMVGTYVGDAVREGVKYAQIEFLDGSTSLMRWDNLHNHMRLFTGKVEDVTLPKTAQDDDEEKNKIHIVPLDTVPEEDDDFSLMDVIPGEKSSELVMLDNKLNGIICNSYMKVLVESNGDFLKSLMLCVLVNESVLNQKAHYDMLQSELAENDPIELLHLIHRQNCKLLQIGNSSHLDIRQDSVAPSYSVKELTLAKHRAKAVFKRVLSDALAA